MRRTARDPGNRLGSAGTPTWLVGGPGAWSRVCDASTLHAWLPDRSLPAERGLCLRHGSRPLILLQSEGLGLEPGSGCLSRVRTGFQGGFLGDLIERDGRGRVVDYALRGWMRR